MTTLPFTLDEFRKDPMRVRLASTPELWPVEAAEALGVIVVRWEGEIRPTTYFPNEYSRLRLAPKTRIVKCRPFWSTVSKSVHFASGDHRYGDFLDNPDTKWLGPAVDVEVSDE